MGSGQVEEPAGEQVSAPTLLERMTVVMSAERAVSWIAAGRVQVEGVVVDDGAQPTPRSQRWLIRGA